ncbi:hypothetical protein OC846_000244 [Tilletia horrida]|uniref:Carrier domain-containing protein n=1 Tax=Tilletia horrida TaxID=155126 RepID=A0AAN6JU04_9BASI|nr:hypothetical protein OC846_000244 [Tilletia horrida]
MAQNEAQSSMATQELIAFPDLTGLRTTAASRTKETSAGADAKADVVQSLVTNTEISQLADILPAGKESSSNEEHVLRALRLAWAISLYFSQAHEASVFGFAQYAPSNKSGAFNHEQIRFEVDPSSPSTLTLAELDELLDNKVDVGSASEADTAIVYTAASDRTLPSLPKAVLLCAGAEGQRLRLDIYASGKVHSDDSAKYQLRQLESLLSSFLFDKDAPAFSSSRFSEDQLAVDRSNFRVLTDDIGPEGLDAERIEYQFERHVQAQPDAPALDFRYHLEDERPSDTPDNVKLTYRELDGFANSIARALREAGVDGDKRAAGTDEIVALFMPKSPETYISILGVCKANATWCPLDVEWPAERQAALFKKCEARFIVTSTDADDAKLEAMKLENVTILRADRIVQKAKADEKLREPLGISRGPANQLAYLVWTSGTTGLPKAVGIQHSAAVQAMRALQRVVPYSDSIRYLQFSEYTFDLSIMDEFWTWGLGGAVCCGTRALLLDSLPAIANATRSTHVILTPAVSAEIRREDIPTLEVLINGGEKLSQVVADEWSRNCCLLNLYGPAEATLIAMNRRVPEGDEVKAPNIGVALPTTALALIDRHGNVLPRGSIGELIIGGPQVAREYVNDPQKTAEKFIQHPLLGRCYRTGDLTRQLWNGELEYLGREDDQVKIDGVRIELLEINAAIKDCHDKVKDSDTMALPKPNNPDTVHIVNFSVVPRGPEHKDTTMLRTDAEAAEISRALREAAIQRLPSNMVPTHFIILSRFPKNSSAKIDRVAIKKALQDFNYVQWESKVAGGDSFEESSGKSSDELASIFAAALKNVYGIESDDAKAKRMLEELRQQGVGLAEISLSKDNASKAKRSEMEELLRKFLAELCGIDPEAISRNTPLPALGLTSLKAMSLTRKLIASGVKCSVLSIIRNNTLGSLSDFLEGVAGKTKNLKAPETQVPIAKEAKDHTDAPSSSQRNAVLATFSDSYLSAVSRHLRIDGQNIEAVLPCSLIQEGMLAESQRDSTSYWPYRKYELNDSNVRVERLLEAVKKVVQGARILRTGFIDASDIDAVQESDVLPNRPNFLQVVHAKADVVIEELDIPDSDQYEKYVQQHARSALSHNALSGQPPLAIWIAKHQDQRSLLFHAHHALYDGITFDLLKGLLQEAYSDSTSEVRVTQYEEALPHLIPMSKEEADERDSVWKTALNDFPRGVDPQFPDLRNGNTAASTLLTTTRIGATKWAALEEAAYERSSTARFLAQMVWARLLALYSGQHDILLGESAAGRDKDPVLASVMGPAITTLPIPISFGNGRSSSDVFDQLHKFHEAVKAHQHVPLAFIRNILEIPRQSALFGGFFVFNNAPQKPADSEGFKLGSLSDFGVVVEHDVALQVSLTSDDELEFELNAVSSKMSEAQLDIMAQQYDELLATLCKSSKTGDDLLNGTVAPQMSANLLSIGPVTPWAEPSHDPSRNVASWVSSWAKQNPSAPALEFHDDLESNATPKVMTYAELDHASQQLAALLHAKYGRQAMVAVSLSRQPATYVALLAILRSGNIYLPIDEALPDERKRELLTDSRAKAVITDTASARGLDGVDQVVVDSETNWAELGKPYSRAPEAKETSEDLAFCLYTSGSTGKPKGCLLTMANLSAAIEAFLDVIEANAPGSFEGGVRYLARSAEAFDVHLKEVLLPLRTGGCIVTAPRSAILQDLGLAMQKLKPTHAAVVPSLFFTQGRRVTPADLPSLKVLIVGGEQIAGDIISEWGRQDKVVVLNAYGPTEASIGISMSRIKQHSLPSDIGPAFPGSQYLILQENQGQLDPVLRGQIGEICIAGLQVGQGYLGQDSVAFSKWNNQRIYRTGDLGRMGCDNEIYYAGRADSSQVKIRGARLELDEVNTKLQELAGAPALVKTIVSKHPEADVDRLIAFLQLEGITSRDETAEFDETKFESAQDLSMKARKALPAHMAPSLVLPVKAIPLAVVSGKVNVRALKILYEKASLRELRGSVSSTSRQSLNDTEKIIAEEAGRTFARDYEFDPSTNLFEAGMDSLSAIRLSARLRKRGLDIGVAAIMGASTLEELASSQDAPAGSSTKLRSEEDFDQACKKLGSKIDEQTRALAGQILPCMPLQSSLIALSKENPKARLYIGTFQVNIKPEVDLAKLRNAWLETLVQHDIYRTIFPDAGKNLAQVVLKTHNHETSWIETSATELDEEINRTAEDIILTIASKPPIRILLNSKARKLVLLAHHAIYDGESVNKLLMSVSDRYSGRSTESAAQFSDVVRQWFRSDSENDASEYWKSYLADYSLTSFPNLNGIRKEGHGPRKETQVQSRISFAVLKEAAQKFSVSPQSLVLSVFAKLLGAYTGEDDNLFGLVLRGRSFDIAGIDDVQGPCVTTIPMFVRSTSSSSSELAKEIQSRTASLLRYQHQPLTKIARAIGASGSLFNTLFAFSTQTASRLTFGEKPQVTMDAEYDLAVEVEADPETGKVSLLANFRNNILGEEQALVLLKAFDISLQGLQHSTSWQDLDASLLSISNHPPQAPEGPHDTFVARFQRHAQDDQRKVAFVYGEQLSDLTTITYGQLDERSTTFAKHLVGSKNNIVALYLPKSVELYVTLIAIWKAGKVYLPIDPSLPAERIRYMLECAEDVTVVTTDELKSTLPPSVSNILTLDTLSSQDPPEKALSKPSLDRGAYLLFTSGSTGRPKGCLISQRALAAALLSWDQSLPASSNSRMLQLASIGFDVSLIEVCMPLARGFAFGAAPKEVLLEDLVSSFHQLGITCADLPAALASGMRRSDLPKLEWLMTGGDMMSEEALKEWAPQGQLINAWGPTETTIGNTLGFVAANSTRNNIGKAYACSSVFILDASRRPVFKGGIGEIAIGGPQVGDGYVGRDDLTKERFVTLENGSKVYLTGDRGRLLVDGSVEFLGRAEQGQVKVNGQRIELDEISNALTQDGKIAEVETLYLQHPGFSSKQLVAFAAIGSATSTAAELAVDDSQEAVDALRSALSQARERLAQYMIPPHFIAISGHLPMTHNNKTDRKALQAFYEGIPTSEIRSFGSKLSNARNDEQPLSPKAQQFCEKFAELCEVSTSDITSSTSVYHLGIDSITAMMLVKSLNRQGYRITVQDTLRCPTVYALARKATGDSTDGQDSQESRTESLADRQDVQLARKSLGSVLDASDLLIPCSPLQSGMLSQFVASDGKAYLLEHKFKTNQTAEKVESAWKTIIQRTDILRTTFHYVTDGEGATGSWFQVVHKDFRPDIERSRDGRSTGQKTLVEGGREEEFLAHGPHHLLIDDQDITETFLKFTVHHALYDGISLPMLFKDLDDELNGRSSEDRTPFADLLPYLLPNDDDVSYWVEDLKDYQPDASSASESSSSSSLVEAHRTIKISSEEATKKCRDLGVSLQTVASLSFAKLLAETTGRSDVVFGQIFALRQTLPSAETVIGPAFNTVPIRITFDSPERSAAEQLHETQSRNDEGRAHRSASLRDIITLVAKEGMQGNLLDALFDFGAQDTSSSKMTSLTAVQDENVDVFGQYSLNASFMSKVDALDLVLTARQETTDASRLEEMAKKYEAIFAELLHNADAPVIRMPDGTKLAVHERKTKTRTEPKPSSEQEEKWKTSQEELVWKAIAKAASLEPGDLTRSTSLASVGLDSISAIGISSALRRQGVRLSAAQLLRGATLGRILDGLSAAEGQSTGHAPSVKKEDNNFGNAQRADIADRLNVKEKDIEQILPVTPGQAWHLALWLKSGRRTNVFSFPIRAPAQLDGERLRQAWKRLVERHQILRTTFVSLGGSVRQVVFATGSVQDSFHVVSTTKSSDVEAATKGIIVEQAQVPEELFTPAVKLFWIGSQGFDSQGAVVLRLFHGLYDAMALELILADLKALCEGREPSSDTGFSKVVQAIATNPHSSQDAEFWSQALEGADQSRFSPDHADEGKTLSPPPYVFEKSAFGGVRQAQKVLQSRRGEEGVSLQNLFIAAVAASIGSRLQVSSPTMMVLHAGRTSASVLTERDGNSEVDVNSVVGPTATLTPLRVSLGESKDSSSLLAATRAVSSDLLNRLEREQAYLGDIYSALGSKASGPLTNVVLNMVWFSGAAEGDDNSANGSNDGKWSHFKVGEAVDFEPTSPFANTEAHALDDLDLAAAEPRLGLDRMEAGLSIDVALNADGDSVGIAVLSNNGAVTTSEARKLVGDIVQRVKDVLSSFG